MFIDKKVLVQMFESINIEDYKKVLFSTKLENLFESAMFQSNFL